MNLKCTLSFSHRRSEKALSLSPGLHLAGILPVLHIGMSR